MSVTCTDEIQKAFVSDRIRIPDFNYEHNMMTKSVSNTHQAHDGMRGVV